MEKLGEKSPINSKPKSKRLSIRRVKGRRYSARAASRDVEVSDSALPQALHRKLWGMFSEIEREFEKVYAENAERKYERRVR